MEYRPVSSFEDTFGENKGKDVDFLMGNLDGCQENIPVPVLIMSIFSI